MLAERARRPRELAAAAREAGEGGDDAVGSVDLVVGVSAFGNGRFAPLPFTMDDTVDLAHLLAFELR